MTEGKPIQINLLVRRRSHGGIAPVCKIGNDGANRSAMKKKKSEYCAEATNENEGTHTRMVLASLTLTQKEEHHESTSSS